MALDLKRISFLLVLVAAKPAFSDDAVDIVRKAVTNDIGFFVAARDYTYLRHHVVTEFDKQGARNKKDDRTDEILVLYGKPYAKLVQKDGIALAEKEAAREEEKLNKEAARRKKDEDKIASAEAREREELKEAIEEITRAFDFRMTGTESLAGRESWKVEATPKEGYEPKSRRARIYPKISGHIWIDCKEHRLVKVVANVDEKISFGWFLLQLEPGAVFEHERIRMDDGAWLPRRDLAKGRAKVAGLKTIEAEVVTSYSGYRRFQTDSGIVSTSGPQD